MKTLHCWLLSSACVLFLLTGCQSKPPTTNTKSPQFTPVPTPAQEVKYNNNVLPTRLAHNPEWVECRNDEYGFVISAPQAWSVHTVCNSNEINFSSDGVDSMWLMSKNGIFAVVSTQLPFPNSYPYAFYEEAFQMSPGQTRKVEHGKFMLHKIGPSKEVEDLAIYTVTASPDFEGENVFQRVYAMKKKDQSFTLTFVSHTESGLTKHVGTMEQIFNSFRFLEQ